VTLLSRHLVLIVFVASLVATTVKAEPSQPCQDVPRPLVLSLSKQERPNALALLGGRDAIALSDAQAASLLGLPSPSNTSLAESLLSESISDMQQRRKNELEHQVGSWSVADAEELSALIRYQESSRSSPPRAFLVHAVEGFEATGAFSASQCGETLKIYHGSLGHSTPQPTTVPVIVFLNREPKYVSSTFSVAE